MPLPNFVIIGAAKAGTTSLYHYLRQHPQVFVCAAPEKETNFFAFEGEAPDYRGPGDRLGVNRCAVTTLAGFRRLYDDVTTERAIGDVSQRYLLNERAPQRIHHHVPHARIIAVLRNPVDRAYSDYLMRRRLGFEPFRDFADALRQEEQRWNDRWSWGAYLRGGFYYAGVKRYADHFGDQLRVYLYDDLVSRPLEFIRGVFGFLDVDATCLPDMARHNAAAVPRNDLVYTMVMPNHFWGAVKRVLPAPAFRRVVAVRERISRATLVKPPALAPELRRELTALYREDTRKLQDLIGRDLSGWLRA